MARIYIVPENINEKEKIIGGKLTLSQGVIAGVSFGLGYFIISGMSKFCSPAVSSVIGVTVGAVLFLFFGIKKYHNLEMTELLLRKHRFKKNPKQYTNTLTYGKKDSDFDNFHI